MKYMCRKITSCALLGCYIIGIVIFHTPVVQAEYQATTPMPTAVIVKYVNDQELKTIKPAAGENITSLLTRLKKDPQVIYAEPDYIFQAAAITPSDLHFSDQWYLKRVKASEGWSMQTQSPNAIIAVIDSGVYIEHPDLKNNIWINTGEINGNKKDDDGNGFVDDRYGWDFVNNISDPNPKFKPGFTEAGILHGTIIAGILGASGNNIEGITGITWRTKIMSLKALDDAGNGDTSRVVKAINYAVDNGATIINLSFVGYSYSQAMKEAIERAVAAGVVVIAPAGNEQSGGHGVDLNRKPIYPACYVDKNNQSLVIGVAATDGIDQKAPFSGYGNTCVDISAPGVGFFSTSVYSPQQSWHGKFFDNYYDGYWSGTSVAVPLVSGALALIQSINPSLTTKESIAVLLNSADNIDALNPSYQGQLGKGRLNLENALNFARASLHSRWPELVIAPANQAEPFIDITDLQGNSRAKILAYDRNFRGGVQVATGDLNHNGNDEIIAAPASSREADIKIFDHTGKFLRHFLAYPKNFQGGVTITAADLNSDGKYEIITAPARGHFGEVKIFTGEGILLRSLTAFPAQVSDGAVVTVGNVFGSLEPEIIVGTVKGHTPQVKIFTVSGKLLSSFTLKERFNGLRISTLDIDANPRRQTAEILITGQSGTAKAVITDFRGMTRRRFEVYLPSFTGDVQTTTADINQDGLKEIISFPGLGGGPHIKFFDYLGNFKKSFYAYPPDFTGGVNMAVLFTQL